MNQNSQPTAFLTEERVRLLRAVMRFRQGEDRAFDEIYVLTCRYLRPMALQRASHHAIYHSDQMVVDRDLAEDMIEDTMEMVFRQLRTGLRNPERYCAWVRTILGNKFKNEYVRRNREFFPSQSGEEEQAWTAVMAGQFPSETELDRRETRILIASGMKHLTEGQRIAVIGTTVWGYKDREIAVRDGIPEGTVKSRKKSGLKKLRESWDEDLPENQTSPRAGKGMNRRTEMRNRNSRLIQQPYRREEREKEIW